MAPVIPRVNCNLDLNWGTALGLQSFRLTIPGVALEHFFDQAKLCLPSLLLPIDMVLDTIGHPFETPFPMSPDPVDLGMHLQVGYRQLQVLLQ